MWHLIVSVDMKTATYIIFKKKIYIYIYRHLYVFLVLGCHPLSSANVVTTNYPKLSALMNVISPLILTKLAIISYSIGTSLTQPPVGCPTGAAEAQLATLMEEIGEPTTLMMVEHPRC